MEDQTRLSDILNRTAIIDVIVGIANALDEKDWTRLRSFLAPEIEVDYSDFRGTPPSRTTAEAYVESREAGLARLKTLHLSTNHEIRIEGNEAACRSAYCIYRVDPHAIPGQDRLDSAGHYYHRLIRGEEGWKVTQIVQKVVFVEGNKVLHGAFR